MENKTLLDVISEILQPVRAISGENYLPQLGMNDKQEWSEDDVLNPLVSDLVLWRIFTFFLYPPACLCDDREKACLCEQKRQEIYSAQFVSCYEAVMEMQPSEEEKSQFISLIMEKFKYTVTEALELYHTTKEKRRDTFMEQCQKITGIQYHSDFITLRKASEQNGSLKWYEQIDEHMKGLDSDYWIAWGIGIHFLSQIYDMDKDQLKTHKKKRTGYLSVKRVIDDYLRKTGNEGLRRMRDCFNNRFSLLSKKKIENAFYKYRSLLPLILGYTMSRVSHQMLKGCRLEALTFFSAFKIQNLFISFSKKTYTPPPKQIFTCENVAIVPDLATCFWASQIFKDLSLAIFPDGKPFIYLKTESFQRILEEQDAPLYLP